MKIKDKFGEPLREDFIKFTVTDYPTGAIVFYLPKRKQEEFMNIVNLFVWGQREEEFEDQI
jgi:hypothetical protein